MRPESVSMLWDVKVASESIADFIEGLDEAGYMTDSLRRSAVERQLEIIGEALRNLRKADPETAQGIHELARIIGLRNVLAHGYAIVDDAVVWGAAAHRVPELKSEVEAILAKAHEI